MLDWAWIGSHLPQIAARTGQHIQLAAIAVAVGFAISFLLALVAIRWRATYPLISGVAGVLYTIPSVAVFAVFVTITGFSILTVEIPLVAYTLVILVRNIVAGFDSVPSDVIDAADGTGYTRGERLLQVELPLAVPLIVAGLRLASVSTIGLVTITAVVSDTFGGLGFFIKDRPFFLTEVLVGALPSVLLAILADLAFAWLQGRLTPWARRTEPISPERPEMAPEPV
jgi:osmoprotectant transport system permease protein